MTQPESSDDHVDAGADGTMVFEGRVSRLASKFSAMWQSASEALAPFGTSFSIQQQRETEGRVQKMMSSEPDVDTSSEENALLQMQRLKTSVRDLVVKSMDPDHREETQGMLSQFSDSGDEFVRKAREFDPKLKPEEIFQALRNLWIINSMQVVFGHPICLNRSGLAYSLLYPYTDNYLDAPAISECEKQEFNRLLGRRLAGVSVGPLNDHAAKVSDLVQMIESEYPRALFPGVYGSLLAIHRAQENSLRQSAEEECCAQREILRISVEKGGTSVLADAYVAKGSLTPLEADFAFGYGVFLQFIDDLQDVGEDAPRGHRTLFTLAANEGSLDGMANRLVWFLHNVLASSDLLSLPRAATLTELVRRSCCSLVLESIALAPSLYSNAYVESVEPCSALRFDCIRKLHDQVRARQERLRKVFRGKRLVHLAAACV
jgi:hypothetical protein